MLRVCAMRSIPVRPASFVGEAQNESLTRRVVSGVRNPALLSFSEQTSRRRLVVVLIVGAQQYFHTQKPVVRTRARPRAEPPPVQTHHPPPTTALLSYVFTLHSLGLGPETLQVQSDIKIKCISSCGCQRVHKLRTQHAAGIDRYIDGNVFGLEAAKRALK